MHAPRAAPGVAAAAAAAVMSLTTIATTIATTALLCSTVPLRNIVRIRPPPFMNWLALSTTKPTTGEWLGGGTRAAVSDDLDPKEPLARQEGFFSGSERSTQVAHYSSSR